MGALSRNQYEVACCRGRYPVTLPHRTRAASALTDHGICWRRIRAARVIAIDGYPQPQAEWHKNLVSERANMRIIFKSGAPVSCGIKSINASSGSG